MDLDPLIARAVANSTPQTLNGMFRYHDPSVQYREWDRPQLNVQGFVNPSIDLKTMYVNKNIPNLPFVRAHEFEHTQQGGDLGQRIPNSSDITNSLWDLFRPQFKNDMDHDYNKEYRSQRNNDPREFLADLAGLYEIHQDSSTRQRMEDEMKKYPKALEQINRRLYPNRTKFLEDTTSNRPTMDEPVSPLARIQNWIRKNTQ